MGCLSDAKKHHPHPDPPLEGEGIHHHQLLPHYRRIGQTSLRPQAEPEAYLSEVTDPEGVTKRKFGTQPLLRSPPVRLIHVLPVAEPIASMPPDGRREIEQMTRLLV
jgi:hypothetical protein